MELYEKRRGMEIEIRRKKNSGAALIASEAKLIDINERLIANLAELSASEERFRTLVLTIPDIVYRIDQEGKFTFLNQAVKRLGYTPEELIGKHFNSVMLPACRHIASRSAVLPKYAGELTGDKKAPKLFDERRTGARKTTGLELRLAVKGRLEPEPGYLLPISDEMVIVEINSSGLWEVNPSAAEKQFIGTVGVIRDISERKAIEQALMESEDRLRKIFEFAQAGIVVIDPGTQTILDANPTALAMIGAPAESVIGEGCRRFFCSTDEKCPLINMKEGPGSMEKELLTMAGEPVPILATVASIQLGGKRRFLESFVDIGKLKKAETELKKAHDELERKVEERTSALKRSQAQLIQTEKVAALGTLTAGIAHELNNPMMGMLNFAQYCLKHTATEDRIHPVLEDILRETRRCVEIVQNLLTFSRVEKDDQENREPVDCAVALERVGNLLKYRIEKEGISLIMDVPDPCPQIHAKIGNLQQVFLNLIGNAFDAVQNSEIKDVRVRIRQIGDHLQAVISDTGPGVRRSDRIRIFDPFFTTKPVGKGTGLGLSISRSIIEKMGGSIECSESDGTGAVFTLSLPIAEGVE